MNLVDVKYNGNNNSESIPSTLFLHVVNCSSETISTNKYPSKIFFGCQNVNMKIAQVSDDNLYTVRIWRSCTSHDTHTYFRCYMIVELYHIRGNPEKFMELLRIFLFTDSVVSLFLSPPHWASWRCGWRNGLRTWRVAASILNKESGQKSNGGPAALCLGKGLTNSQLKCFTMGWCGLLWIR